MLPLHILGNKQVAVDAKASRLPVFKKNLLKVLKFTKIVSLAIVRPETKSRANYSCDLTDLGSTLLQYRLFNAWGRCCQRGEKGGGQGMRGRWSQMTDF